ncbi:MAG: phosphoadenylyl-sulfate reductase [Shimia sp.]
MSILQDQARALDEAYQEASPHAMLRAALTRPGFGRTAIVSSFGADSVVLLHMAAALRPDVPVIFLDTEMLFPETLTYQQGLAKELGLTNIRRITPDRGDLLTQDVDGLLHQADTDACCALRKARPLARALAHFDTWITGRKRFQTGARRAMPLFEAAEGRIKVNPLARWDISALQSYILANDLPRHPMVARGYPSIGCMPCTHPASALSPREGRWKGSGKTECGIHFPTQPQANERPHDRH